MVLPYNDGKPAILDRSIGQGRVLTMTTPDSDRLSQQSPWNLLPAGDDWPFLILINQMAAYLVGSNNQQLNYFAGQTAVLPVDPSAQRGSYLLSAPGDLSFPISADLKRHELAITATDQVGNYRLQAGGSGGVDLGFSVNYGPDQTRLDRLNDEELAGSWSGEVSIGPHSPADRPRHQRGPRGPGVVPAVDRVSGVGFGAGDGGGKSVLQGVDGIGEIEGTRYLEVTNWDLKFV